MAAWQFKLVPIPKSWLDSGGELDALYEVDGLETRQCWLSYRNPMLVGGLGKLLPRSESWHPQLLTWGSTQSDDIQLFVEDDAVVSLFIRFDLRRNNKSLFAALVECMKDYGLVALVPDLRRVVEPDMSALQNLARTSDAARFVADPQAFLASIDSAHARET